MKIVFMGTPDFSVGALKAIVEAGYEVTAVVTQPDKSKGRGKETQPTPVKIWAMEHNIPVFQPIKVKTAESMEILKSFPADIFIVAAFGQILSQEILDMPKYGCVNIHASLLPKYRGAAPIQWAILNGETETGVTIMQMDTGIDTGDMLNKVIIPITETDTGESLHDKLCEAGANLLVKTLPLIENGTVIRKPQDSENSCYAKMLTKAQGNIDWNKPAVEISRLVRGLNSWPSAYTYYRGKLLKIWEVSEPQDEIEITETFHEVAGTIVKRTKEKVWIQCGSGLLELSQVQPEGKKKMSIRDFLLGYSLNVGDKFVQETGLGK